MPFSSDSGKAFTDRAVLRLTKQVKGSFFDSYRILDLGPGSGTYSDRYSKSWLKRPEFKWTGVEVWEPYVKKYHLRDKYDEVVVADVRTYLRDQVLDNQTRFDVCFIGDLAEHMSKVDAEQLVDHALRISRVVIISIPIVHYPQDEYDGNPYEAHVKDDWSDAEVVATFGEHLVPNGRAVESEIGVYVLARDDYTKRLVGHVLEPQVGVYSICKNEEEFIGRMYESVRTADYISICDTGSTDSTFKILTDAVLQHSEFLGHEDLFHVDENLATCHFMRVRRICVSPWRFDDAHNAALLALPEELDVCISIDADEFLEPHFIEDLKKLVGKDLVEKGKPNDRYHHRFSTRWNWRDASAPPNASSHWHERVHSRHNYVWKLPVHEVLVKLDGTPENITWCHHLQMTQWPDVAKSRNSYLPLLEVSVREDPARWKSWSFLAGEYERAGRFDDAVKAIKQALELDGSDKAHLCAQLAGMYLHRGDATSAIANSLQAIAAAPKVREYKVYLAEIYEFTGDFFMAQRLLEEAERLTDKPQGYEFNASCWGERFEARKEKVRKLLRDSAKSRE